MLNASMNIIFSALIFLAIGMFTSISIGAVSHILLALGIILFIVTDPKRYKDSLFEKKQLMFSLLAFMLAIVVSVIFNWGDIERPFKNLLKVKYFLIPFLSVPALHYFFKERLDNKKLKILFYIFLGATTLATISGLIGLYSGFNPIKFKAACHQTRACGLFGMYMTYGYGISLFMVLITGSLLHAKDRFPIKILGPVAVINFIGLILSYARGGWLGYFLSVPFYFFKRSPKRFLIGIGTIIVILASLVTFHPGLNKKFIKDRTHSNSQRVAFYQTAFKAFQEKPILGWGYKNYEANVKDLKKKYKIAYPEFGADAHNIFLEALASTGLVGMVCFLYFFIAWLLEAYRGSSIIHKLSFPFVISLAISGQVQNVFGDGENLFLIMFTWSLLAAFPGDRRNA